ncbi:MAG: pyrophosphatase PpaX [Gaiellales bacterium]|jgi:pyrophosphatase PpaX|nr:pyrophosphatase PpaX [Gaiellales bacterium]
MSYSTVIFDLDGTLIDTVPLIVASHRHALATVLGRELPEAELREGIGRPLLEQMRVFDEARAQELFDVYREFNHRVHDDYVRVFEGMLELCDELRARGIPVAVATSKMLDAVLLAYGIVPGLEERIDAMVTIENTATHKPGPEPITHALELLGRGPEGAVYVGDAPSDLRAARAAGVAGIGVTWGAFSSESLAAERPDAIATTPADLARILLEPADG